MRLPIMLSMLMLILPVTVYSSDEPLSLTLNAAIRMAVEKNLDVRAELYNPAQFEADINRYRSIYDPVVALQANYTDTSTETFSSAGLAVSTRWSKPFVKSYASGRSTLAPT